MANYNQPYQNNNKNNDNMEVISWILIAICFMVAWPLGVLLLISKLRDNKSGGKTKRTAVNSRPQYQQPQYQQPAQPAGFVCPRCGTQQAPGTKFCARCGQPF